MPRKLAGHILLVVCNSIKLVLPIQNVKHTIHVQWHAIGTNDNALEVQIIEEYAMDC